MNWTCPHCEHRVTITSDRFSSEAHLCSLGPGTGPKHITRTTYYLCPNKECQKLTLFVEHGEPGVVRAGHWQIVNPTHSRLIPSASGRTFPDYVPRAVIDDYNEACSIQDLSPKAAATLARRCLQGILRDFWKVKPGRLVDEIEAIVDKVEPDVWAAIDSVRKIGNIGAHMEKDINQIIEVDSDEAKVLLELIEMLIDEWYVARHVRQARLQQIVEIAKAKA